MAVTANIYVNGVQGSDDNVTLSSTVTLSNVSSPTASSYLWEILTQPEGTNTDLLSSSTAASPTFVPTKEGSYLIRLTVDQFLPSEASQQIIVGVRELETQNRIPAAGETTENDGTTGWSNTAVDYVLQRVTRLTDSGVFVGKAGASGIVSGTVVAATDKATIGTDTANQRVVPVFTSVNATSAAITKYQLAVAVGAVVGGGTPASGALMRAIYTGLVQGIVYPLSAPAVGDPVYVGDSGLLSLTAGTYTRPCGTVAAVDTGAGTFAVWFGGGISSAGGGGSPTGPAGGVLGYPGSTYPDPNGLAPSDGSAIPVLGIGSLTTAFRIPEVNAASQAPSIALEASGNTGTGDGGDAYLLGGGTATANGAQITAGGAVGDDGGAASVTGGASDAGIGGHATVMGGAPAPGYQGGNGYVRGADSPSGSGGNAGVIAGDGVNGGATLVAAGNGTTGTGGATDVRGGSSTGNDGGPVTVIGGGAAAAGSTSGTGKLDAGPATGAAAAGTADVGTAFASKVNLGRVDIDVDTHGRNVETPVLYDTLLATPIPVTSSTIFLTNATPVGLLGAVPNVQTDGIVAGTIVTLVQIGAGGTALWSEISSAGSALRLDTAASKILNQYDTLRLIFTGTDWVQISYSNNI